MLWGPSGIGKTMLAEAIAGKYGTSLIRIAGYMSVVEIIAKLMSAQAFDFIFVDEAHGMKPSAQELLYGVIDKSRVPNLYQSKDAGTEKHEPDEIEIQRCSIIAASDQPGLLLNALRKRFALQMKLDAYSHKELKEIVDRQAADMGLLVSPQAAKLVAQVSAGLPRKAKHHLQNLRYHFPWSESRQIGRTDVCEFLREFEIDRKGLGSDEREYLRFLQEQGSASLGSLAQALGTDTGFVLQQIEAPLVHMRFITIGHAGRTLTPAGRSFLEYKPKPSPQNS